MTYETSRTAKAAKMIGALNEVRKDYTDERTQKAFIDAINLPMDSLARLHDIIVGEPK